MTAVIIIHNFIYEKKVITNKFINIKKMNIHLSHQIIEHQKDHHIGCQKSKSRHENLAGLNRLMRSPVIKLSTCFGCTSNKSRIFLQKICIIIQLFNGVQAIDQNIFPEVLGKTKVFYGPRGQRPRSIEHFGLSQYRGKNCLIYVCTPIK